MNKISCTALLLVTCTLLRAQPGKVDTTFDPGSCNYFVYGIALQPDGKIILGGAFTNYKGAALNSTRIVRANVDATHDNSFWTGSGFDNSVMSVALEANGKVIAGGQFTNFNGTPCNKIVRLNTNGSLDTSFHLGNGFNGDVYKVGVDGNGKIIATGQFTVYNGKASNHIVRINGDGSADTSFNSGAVINSLPTGMLIQSDNKILVGCSSTSCTLVRFNTNGTQDTSFHVGSSTGTGPSSMAIQPDGKILVAGAFTVFNGVWKPYIVRLDASGATDTTFNLTGSGFSYAIQSIALETGGKIVVGGGFASYNGISRNNIARLNPDGSLDATFDPGTGFNNGVLSPVAIQPDGKILVGGYFTSYDGHTRNYVARIEGGDIVAAEKENELPHFKLFPNPSGGAIQVTGASGMTFEICDQLGRSVVLSTIASTEARLDLSSVAKGIYFYAVIKEGRIVKNGKIILQ